MDALLAGAVTVGILIGIYGVVAIALNFQYGEAGLINFGVVAYFAVGAYTFAILTAGPPSETALDQYRWGFNLNPLLAALIAGLVGVIFAVISGWPALRLRGEYLALTTFAFAEVLQSSLVNVRAITNGTSGFAGIVQPFRDVFDNYNLFILALATALLLFTMWFFQRLVRSPYGRTLRAIKGDEVGVTASGKSPEKYRREAFFLSAFFIALAGVVFVIWLTLARPTSFGAEMTFFVWIAMILGGEGSNWRVLGAIAGLVILDELIGALPLESVEAVQRVHAGQTFLTGLLFVLVLRWRTPKAGVA
ncbi:MAG: branched-chain amino acid ABC transporter permease [Acidimicrobiia bacterium]